MSDPAPPQPRRRTFLVVLSVGLIVGGAVGAWWLFDPGPAALLRKGLLVAPLDPAEGESWMRRALRKSGGHFPDAEIALARLLAKQGDWTEASALFAGLDKSACRADLLLAFGRDLLPSEHRTEALASLEFVGQHTGPEAIEALELLLQNYQDWGAREETIKVANRLTELEPDNPQRWARLIDLLKAMSRETDCLNVIRDAQTHDLPDEYRKELQHRLLQQLVIQGDAAEVRRELEVMRKMEGESIRVRGHEVFLLRLEGKSEQALKLLTELAPQVPDRPFLYFNLGILHLDLGHFAEAVENLKRVVEAQPNQSPAQFKLSEAYRNLGQDDLARQHQQLAAAIVAKRKRIDNLLKLRATEPENSKIYQELAQLHLTLGEPQAAQQWKHWLEQHRHPAHP